MGEEGLKKNSCPFVSIQDKPWRTPQLESSLRIRWGFYHDSSARPVLPRLCPAALTLHRCWLWSHSTQKPPAHKSFGFRGNPNINTGLAKKECIKEYEVAPRVSRKSQQARHGECVLRKNVPWLHRQLQWKRSCSLLCEDTPVCTTDTTRALVTTVRTSVLLNSGVNVATITFSRMDWVWPLPLASLWAYQIGITSWHWEINRGREGPESWTSSDVGRRSQLLDSKSEWPALLWG